MDNMFSQVSSAVSGAMAPDGDGICITIRAEAAGGSGVFVDFLNAAFPPSSFPPSLHKISIV